uniref:Hyaluronidase n=1 Tax=Mola mola TaxID=94237 RepID=A0A3Q3WT91_MOLML
MSLFHLLFILSLSQTSTQGSALPQSPPAAVAAAGPILQDRPFVVVWNMPTAQCKRRYNIDLDLGDFDIMENRHQSFQGEKMTIFYRDRLGKYPYLSRKGMKVNGGIPQLGDLSVHLSLAKTQLSSLLKPNFKGLAVIDWEEWHPLWERNFGAKMVYCRLSKLLARQEGPDLSERAITSLAKQRFEASARKYMEETLRSAVKEHPKGLWGFYGFPFCSNKHKRGTDNSYTGRCQKRNKKQNDQLSWLWGQSTALYPSIYLPRRLEGSVDAALMVRHTVLEALRVASVWRHINASSHTTPVLPYARLAFTHTLTFLNETDLVHTLGESAALGAAGVVLWGEVKFAKSMVCNVCKGVTLLCVSDTHHCSLQLCHGNGRCARRCPSSGRMFPPGPTVTSESEEINLIVESPRGDCLHSHFLCLCYPGWTGQECQFRILSFCLMLLLTTKIIMIIFFRYS